MVLKDFGRAVALSVVAEQRAVNVILVVVVVVCVEMGYFGGDFGGLKFFSLLAVIYW